VFCTSTRSIRACLRLFPSTAVHVSLQTLLFRPSSLESYPEAVSDRPLEQEGRYIRKQFAVLGATVGALAMAAPAQANDLTGARLDCTGAYVNVDKFGSGSHSIQVKMDSTSGPGTWVSVPFVGPSGSFSWPAPPRPAAPRALYVKGYAGSSETVPVATFSGECPVPAPPVVTPPVTTPPGPPVVDNQCISRRTFRVRVARKWKNKLTHGEMTYWNKTSKLRLVTKGKQKGKLTGIVRLKGLHWTRDRKIDIAFKVYPRSGGAPIEAIRRYRPCTPKKGTQPPVLNIPIGGEHNPLMVQ
jgi:hypothetical protein